MHNLPGFFRLSGSNDFIASGSKQFAQKKKRVQLVIHHQNARGPLLLASILLPRPLRYGCHRKMRRYSYVEGCIEQLSKLALMWIVFKKHKKPAQPPMHKSMRPAFSAGIGGELILRKMRQS